jgi:hypothetical protein
MKIINRIITISITSFSTAFISAVIICLVLFGGSSGELILPVFIISLIVVLLVGTPVALLINRWLRSNSLRMLGLKVIVHAIAGVILIAIWLIFFGEIKRIFSGDALIFYICAMLNSIIYLLIFSLLKLTGETDFK